MAQSWYCSTGDGLPAVVVLSSLDAGEATGEVSTPCAEHWLGLCAAVCEASGLTVSWPEVVPGIETEAGTEPAPETGLPDLQVAKVVRRGQRRPRSKAEQGAMHAHLREAEAGDQSG